eukprot:gene4648-117_t
MPPAHPAIGRMCEKCDGKCVICDSYVRPAVLVRICDECNYGSNQAACRLAPVLTRSRLAAWLLRHPSLWWFLCQPAPLQGFGNSATWPEQGDAASSVGNQGLAMHTTAENAPSSRRMYAPSRSLRDGCPKIINLGSAKTDLYYEHKKYGFRKR